MLFVLLNAEKDERWWLVIYLSLFFVYVHIIRTYIQQVVQTLIRYWLTNLFFCERVVRSPVNFLYNKAFKVSPLFYEVRAGERTVIPPRPGSGIHPLSAKAQGPPSLSLSLAAAGARSAIYYW